MIIVVVVVVVVVAAAAAAAAAAAGTMCKILYWYHKLHRELAVRLERKEGFNSHKTCTNQVLQCTLRYPVTHSGLLQPKGLGLLSDPLLHTHTHTHTHTHCMVLLRW